MGQASRPADFVVVQPFVMRFTVLSKSEYAFNGDVDMAKNRFGYQWSRYPQIIPLYEHQFQAWTHPVQKSEWKGKTVLDAGCGIGRNSYWPIQYGVKHVVAFDEDPRTVAVAKHNLAPFVNCTVEACSIYETPWTDEFDLVMSIGVIHHLADPKKAVRNLVHAARPGGQILVWVYGKEGFTTLKAVINTVRRVTSKLPHACLTALVYPFSFLWWVYMRSMPHRHPYMKQLQSATLWHLHSILFDQLVPEIANYWSKEEALSLFEGLEVEECRAFWVNHGSWTILATKSTGSNAGRSNPSTPLNKSSTGHSSYNAKRI